MKACCSSISNKVVVAVTGVLLLGFVVVHLSGNLLIFWGPNALNAYSQKLHDLGPLLWVSRVLLLVVAVLHVALSILLAVENRKARPIAYMHKATLQTSLPGRTMALSGLTVLAFVIYHLLHFTFRITHPDISYLTDSLGRHDVYTMVVSSFQSRPVAFGYTVAITFLCLHLKHGIASAPQTWGLNNEKSLGIFEWSATAISLLMMLGYISIPLAVQFGLIGPFTQVCLPCH